MKKTFLMSAFILATMPLFALNYNSKLTVKEKDGTYKFSKVSWYSDNMYTSKLPGVPKKSDSVNLMGRVVVLDVPLNISSITINGNLLAENQKVTIGKGGIQTHFGVEGEVKSFTFRNSVLTSVGSLSSYNISTPSAQAYGCTFYRFEDSTATFNSNCILTYNLTRLGNKKEPSGFGIVMTGKTLVSFKGNAMIDPMTISNPKFTLSLFEFIEKNGNMPMLTFQGKINDFANSTLKVRFTDKLKNGKYTLIHLDKPNMAKGEFKKVTINNISIKFGETKKIGNFKCSVNWEKSPLDKDNVENDIVLTVE